jgi:heme-degrading monooxygenase HmoA
MADVLVKIKVENYDKWKSMFDKFVDDRKSKGSKGATIFRDAKDPNLVMILLKWDDLSSAQKFYGPQISKEIPQKGGVIEEEIYFLNEIEKTSA